jgi:hypothetical protein
MQLKEVCDMILLAKFYGPPIITCRQESSLRIKSKYVTIDINKDSLVSFYRLGAAPWFRRFGKVDRPQG